MIYSVVGLKNRVRIVCLALAILMGIGFFTINPLSVVRIAFALLAGLFIDLGFGDLLGPIIGGIVDGIADFVCEVLGEF